MKFENIKAPFLPLKQAKSLKDDNSQDWWGVMK